MPNALLLINRTSRQGDRNLEAGLEFLRGRGFSLEQMYPKTPEAIAEAIRRHGPGRDLVILGGGDGTLHAATAAVLECGLPLGILPMGTANDLARTLGIPLDPEQACQVIAAGRVRRIDLGRVNGYYFLNAASIGLGVRITHRLSRELKAKWGVLAYALCVAAALRENRSFSVDVVCDGRHFRHRSIQITVGNGRHYGGGMTIAAEAAIDDRCLNLFSLEPQSLWSLLRLIPSLWRGEYPVRPGIHLMSGQQIEIRTRHRLPVSADGEPTTHTPANFLVLGEMLPVFVPSEKEGKGD